MNFSDLGVPADLVAVLDARGITEPFPVQRATIADAIAGRDLCAKAPTGSGKTLAFGLPLAAGVRRAAPKKPSALILAPTRELAAQIQRELAPLAQARGRRVFTIYGGVGYEPQRKALRKGVDILVACPGRLKDLIDQHAVRLDAIDVVVIDEADRMADMGFLPEVRKLLDQMPPTRQTLLFSATLDGDIATLTRNYQRDPVHHESAGVNDVPADLEHRFIDITPPMMIDSTVDVIRKSGPTIVFCRTRHRADRVAKQLRAAGVDAAAIHGGLSQNKRDQALARFKTYEVEALVATDVAARGIHVDAVACVVHYDLPGDAKTYTHRSGRTGRAGATGVVVTLVTQEHRKAARALRNDLDLDVADEPKRPNVSASRPSRAATVAAPARGRGRGQGGDRARSRTNDRRRARST